MSFWLGLNRQQLRRALILRYDLPRLQRAREIDDHVHRHGVERIPLVIDTHEGGSFFIKEGNT
jgi:hypothetical protein